MQDALGVFNNTYVFVDVNYQTTKQLCFSGSLLGKTWFDMSEVFEDVGELDNVVVTTMQTYYHFRNGSLFYCGDYFVPNFNNVSASVRQFPLKEDALGKVIEDVTILTAHNNLTVIATIYNVYFINFTD